MTKEDIFAAIGCFFNEAPVTQLLTQFDISEKPRLPRNDDVAYLSDKVKGIEVAFTDASTLDEPFASARSYPEGALVLTSVDFFGRPGRKFAVYQGELPVELRFGMSRKDVEKLLGPADDEAMDGDIAKWIDGHKCLVCEFDEDALTQVSCQMALASDLE